MLSENMQKGPQGACPSGEVLGPGRFWAGEQRGPDGAVLLWACFPGSKVIVTSGLSGISTLAILLMSQQYES